MEYLFFSYLLFFISALSSYIIKKAKYVALISILASLMGLISSIKVFATQQTINFTSTWNVPYGLFSLKIDQLSAFFLIVILSIALITAIYSIGYFEKMNPSFWSLFNLLILSMILVVSANNSILFLFGWEIMSIVSYFLVVFDHEKEMVRKAGLIYLFASQICMVFLLTLFILINKTNFDEIALQKPLFFILALIGFGIKCGFFPFHIWLIDAHPVAPSPISALMSAVMIKLGIYGILRTLTFYSNYSFAIYGGWSLIIIGSISGIFGISLALAQKDLKKMLAYSSVENIGVISISLGLALLGVGLQLPFLAILGLIGALFHLLNHALFKSLLFLGAGAIFHLTHTLNLNSMGGLIKKAKILAISFLIASLSISAIPLLNGFIGEFFIYKAAFYGILNAPKTLLVIIAMAFISGLTLVCFTNCFGMIFLGNAKCDVDHKLNKEIKLSLILLSSLLFLVSFLFLLLPTFSPIVQQITHFDAPIITNILSSQVKSIIYILAIAFAFFLLFGTLWWIRKKLYKKELALETVTWDCGFSKPTNRMQYTFTSFSQSLTSVFKINTDKKIDPLKRALYKPLFELICTMAMKLRWIQQGKLQIYILYIFLTLIGLLIYWKLS